MKLSLDFMILILANGEKVVVHRMNCGHQYKDYRRQYTRVWNIDPVEIVDEDKGFFAIGKWGTTADEHCEMLIPIRSVVAIENPNEWDKDDVVQIRKVLPDISTLRKRMDNIEVGS